MAKKKGGSRRRGFTVPVAVLAGFAPLGFGLVSATKRALAGDTAGASQELVIRTTGYNTDTKRWHSDVFMQSYGPVLAGLVVHKLASRLGVNRLLGQAKIPFLRI